MPELIEPFHSLTPFDHVAVRKELKQRSKLIGEDQLAFASKLPPPKAVALGQCA